MLGAFQGLDEAGLSDWVRANSECRDLLLVRFGADFPAFVEAGIVGVAQGRIVEGRWPVVRDVGGGHSACRAPGVSG